jgi:two-component system sensor histidine kinase PhoQ
LPEQTQTRSRLSLQARQLLAASLGLFAFLGLTGFALDRAFTETAQSNLRERLKSYAYAYFGGMDFTRGKVLLPPETPPDPRFNRPGSGLYAAARGDNPPWQSQSAIGHPLPLELTLAPGVEVFEGPLKVPEETLHVDEVYHFAMGLIWDVGAADASDDIALTFHVFEDADALAAQISVFRRALWGYLGAAALLLLGVQIGVLRWSLQPLSRVAREMARVRSGEAERLQGPHPRELEPLTGSINAFIASEREHMERYRNTLADLAHSLKTPLAVLRARLDADADADELRQTVQAQIARMSDIVSYQLARAARSGHRLYHAPEPIAAHAEHLVQGLEKVYAGRGILCEFELDQRARFHGEPGDLLELLGNLLENAFKWARQRVLLSTRVEPVPGSARAGLLMTVEDDGPGIAPEQVDRLLQRGVRGDERVQGHGIGLAIVQDIVRGYRGELTVDRSPELGGARFSLRFPPPR